MKQLIRIALYGIIAVAAAAILQNVWWLILTFFFLSSHDSFVTYDYDAVWEAIPCVDTLFNLVFYLQFVKIAGFLALLYFFYKLYNIQTEDMKKPSLYAIYGIVLIIAGTICFTFSDRIFEYSNSLQTICFLLQIVGFALLIPFFLTLYKRSN